MLHKNGIRGSGRDTIAHTAGRPECGIFFLGAMADGKRDPREAKGKVVMRHIVRYLQHRCQPLAFAVGMPRRVCKKQSALGCSLPSKRTSRRFSASADFLETYVSERAESEPRGVCRWQMELATAISSRPSREWDASGCVTTRMAFVTPLFKRRMPPASTEGLRRIWG